MKKLVTCTVLTVFFCFAISPPNGFAKSKSDKLSGEFSKRERYHSNYICTSMNTSSIEICDVDLEKEFNALANQLAKSSGISNPNIKVRIFALPIALALSLPNEQILISSAMLDKIKNKDQLSFLFAHEIGHLYHHDMDELIQKKIDVEAMIMMASMVLAVGAGVALAVAAPAAAGAGSYGATAGVSTGSQIALNVAQNVATNAIYTSANWMKDEMYVVIEKGYSEESELRADEMAFKLISLNEDIDVNSATESLKLIKDDIIQRYEDQNNLNNSNTINAPQSDQQTLIPAAEGQPIERATKSSEEKEIKKAYDEKIALMNKRIEKLESLAKNVK